jgi:glutamate/tyrosine decarboxylase-like PLP-dependent enzyme
MADQQDNGQENKHDSAGRDSLDALLRDVAGRSARYLDGLGSRAVLPADEAVERGGVLLGALPDEGESPEALIALLDEIASPATVASAGPRYFGFVTGGALPAALAANWLAGAWDQNCFSSVSSPIAAAMESCVIGWLAELFGLPPGCGGGFVTGATMANFSGLAAARHAVLEEAGWDVESRGLRGAPPVTIVVGAKAHTTLFKSLGLLGFGRDAVVSVPVDGQGRMRADAFPDISAPAILCLQAGNVNSGAFDPAPDLIPLAQAKGAWVHVDGAFGLWAAAAPERAPLMAGFAEADSWAVDAHKWLNVPYDSGIVLVRRPQALAAAMSINAAYLLKGRRPEPFDFTPDSSRRMRSVDIWAALRSLGRRGVAGLIEKNCRQAARFAQGLGDAGFEILNEVVLNQVLVSFGSDEETARVIEAIQADGTCWCGGTVWQGRAALRLSVSSWATGDDDVEVSLEAMIRAASAGSSQAGR